MIYEYGAMSSKFSCEAENKLTAYVCMVAHWESNAFMVAIYAPEECKKDSWMSFDGKIAKSLHLLFGGKEEDYPDNDAFDKYIQENIQDIKKCYKTIKQLI